MKYVVYLVSLIAVFTNIKLIYQTVKYKEYKWMFIFIATMLNLLFSVYVVLKNQ